MARGEKVVFLIMKRAILLAGGLMMAVAANAASVKIEGDKVIVWSDAVPAPVAVRYAWNNNQEGCNLYNSDGLPCVPFRSDDWPCKTLDSHKSFITP